MQRLLLLSLAVLLSCGKVQNNKTIQSPTIQSPTIQLPTKQLLKDIEAISSDDFQGRKTGTIGAEMTRTYLTIRLNEIGLKSYPGQNGFEQEFDIKIKNGTEIIKGKNLIAYIPGKTDSVIVISAHYDHLGIINNVIYNGADDNASGVAGLLQFAEYFTKNKPNHSMIFAFFDAEEIGLLGAKAFVANPPIKLEKIKLNINMDMISHNNKGELYAVGTFKYPALKRYFTNTNSNIKILFGHDDPKLGSNDWTNQSDQGAFNEKNIPFIYFGVEDHKDYHKTTDKYQNINNVFFIDAVNAIQEIIINMDK